MSRLLSSIDRRERILTVDPAATLTVAVAAPGVTLQVRSEEVADVTGLLLMGRRTAAELVVLPAIRVVQMSRRRMRPRVLGRYWS